MHLKTDVLVAIDGNAVSKIATVSTIDCDSNPFLGSQWETCVFWTFANSSVVRYGKTNDMAEHHKLVCEAVKIGDLKPPSGWCDYCSGCFRGTDDCSFPDKCEGEVR